LELAAEDVYCDGWFANAIFAARQPSIPLWRSWGGAACDGTTDTDRESTSVAATRIRPGID
jgi:hypothetical protein